jgi:hypothetical protein
VRRAFLVVRLPGLPPEEFEALGPERAIRQLGGSIPGGRWALEFMGEHLIASHPRFLKPRWLQEDAELLTVQIAAAPASFWRRLSSQP